MPQVNLYQISGPAVIGEVVDGEAIIVNLDTGVYYSLRDPGATLWSHLEQPVSLDSLTTGALERYAGDRDEITAWVRSLVDELVQEGLLRTLPAVASETRSAPSSNALVKTPFVASALTKYTDMADLLLLDPIHEVGESGWPASAPR